MVTRCCVVGCNSSTHNRRGEKIANGFTFNRFPAWRQNHGGEVSEITVKESSARLDRGYGELQQPSMEQLMNELRRMQQGLQDLEEEITELKSTESTLQEELAASLAEAHQVEETLKEKEDVCRKLQLECDESEKDCARKMEQNKMTEDLIEQYKCEIQEIKLKHRKLRMRFANQLQQLTEEHKKLHSVFSLEGLPDQLKSSEETINQLLSVEQRKLAQWQELSEEVEKLKKQAQLETVAPQPQDE